MQFIVIYYLDEPFFLIRKHSEFLMTTFSEIGKTSSTFGDAAEIANSVLQCGYEFDRGTMYFNIFRWVLKYAYWILIVKLMKNQC